MSNQSLVPRAGALWPVLLVALACVAPGCGDDGGESSVQACGDEIDNDGDGLTDCSDSDCAHLDSCNIAGCSPSNCAGCCGAGGTCFDGTEQNSCGFQGMACDTCSLGETCSMAECRAIRENCTNGTDDDQDGAADCLDTQCALEPACATCTVAAAGQLITDSCTVSDICVCSGTEDFCTDGDCEAALAQQYVVDIISATLPATKPDSSCWDVVGCGAPDIWVDVRLANGTEVVASITRDDVFSAEWTTAYSLPLTLVAGTELVVIVYDDDGVAGSEGAFQCMFTLDAARLRSRTLDCTGALGTLAMDIFPE